MVKNVFDFVKLNGLPPKPRETSVLEIRGPYYTPMPASYLKGILEDWSEWFDGVKFAGGSFRLLDDRRIREYINLCHDYDVYVSTGGWIERVLIDGPDAADKYLDGCKAVGFDVVEISSGMAPEIMRMPLEDKVALVKRVRRLGMRPKPEVSIMVGAGGGTHRTGYMKMYRPLKEFLDEAEAYIKAGASMIMFESEGVTEDMPPEKWRKDIINAAVKRLGYKKWMFEAADPEVFKWYYKTFGTDVNLFVDHSQVVEFNAWRLGLWGDSGMWKGKRIRYDRR